MIVPHRRIELGNKLHIEPIQRKRILAALPPWLAVAVAVAVAVSRRVRVRVQIRPTHNVAVVVAADDDAVGATVPDPLRHVLLPPSGKDPIEPVSELPPHELSGGGGIVIMDAAAVVAAAAAAARMLLCLAP